MGRGFGPAGLFGFAHTGAALALALGVASCGKSNIDPKYGVPASQRVVGPGEPAPKGGGTYRVGRPYQVAGRTYVPQEDPEYDTTGVASWYGVEFHGRKTANGEVFDMHSVSAAHPTLPIPSYVRVTNLRNKRSLIVRVNDRGPFHENRVIDVSVRAAKLLDFHQFGVTRVRVQYVGRAALEGSDDEKLAATLRRDGSPAPGPRTAVASVRNDRPYQPEYFDPRPNVRAATGRAAEPPARTVRRTPAAAETVARAPAAPAARTVEARPPERAVAAENSFDSRFGPAVGVQSAPLGEPASAFAPRFDSVMTGRGIY
jgi:rare lipoprotein A